MSINSWDRLRAPSWAALASMFALLTTHAAAAQECADDDDCDDGYVCKTVRGVTTCPTQPACDPGDEACTKVPPSDSDSECEQQNIKQCVAAPCEEDSECPDNMACHAFETSRCSGTSARAPDAEPCPDGEDCPGANPVPKAEDCQVESVSQCTPRYQLPCTENADCGEGFKCKEEISVSCAGSSGSMSGGSSGAPMPDDGAGQNPKPAPTPEADDPCESMPTGEFRCELQVLPCEANDECPADFECVDNPNRAVCNSAVMATPPDQGDAPADDPGAGGKAGTEPADAGTDTNADKPVPDDSCGEYNDGLPEKTCLPLHYYESGGANIDLDGTFGNTSGTANPMTTDKGEDAAEPPDDRAGDAGTITHSHSKTDDDAAADDDDDGCSVTAPGAGDTSPALGLLGMLGFCALALRRRARKAA